MSVLGLPTHYSGRAVGWVTWEIRFSTEQKLLSPLFWDRIWNPLSLILNGFPGGKAAVAWSALTSVEFRCLEQYVYSFTRF